MITKYNANNTKGNSIKFEGDRLKAYDKTGKNILVDDDNIRNIYRGMKKYIWINKKPFDEVLQLLRIVAGTCAKELKNKS